MQTKDTAICLRAVSYSETSQVVTLLTREHGKVAAMAKGSRRAKSAFDGPIEVFSSGPVMFIIKDTGGKLANLTEFTQQPRFRGLQQNLYALNAGLFATELTEAFLEDHDPHPVLFDKFIKFLETLQTAEDDASRLAWLILYQLRLLEEIGVAPALDVCVNCSLECSPNWKTAWFSSHSNGLLCAGCEAAFVEKRSLQPQILNILQNPQKLPKTPQDQLRQIEQLLIYHLTELRHKPPKMAKYFT